MKVAIVIPARYASERFPGKPLAAIAGVPMIVRVWRNMRGSRTAHDVVVATDDPRIAAVIEAEGGRVAMTDPALPSGSDRVWAAIADEPVDLVVNVQGDEPLLPPAVVDALVDGLVAQPGFAIATPVVSVPRAEVTSADHVTVARADDGTALYFSRSPIPHGAERLWRHVGVYAYRKAALERFVASPPAALERTERLEQLRALALGLPILAVPVAVELHAVDRPADVARVEALLAGTSAADLPVELVVLDVDGVLTTGAITYVGSAEQALTFDVKDGHGIKALRDAGVTVAVLSGRDSAALRWRCAELGITHVVGHAGDKGARLDELCAELGIDPRAVCYVGDDVPDLAAMRRAGLCAAPADAHPAVRVAADWVLTAPGGRGAVRELADALLGAGRRRPPHVAPRADVVHRGGQP